MKDIDYDKKALEEKYKKYKEREQIALAKNKEWYKRELKKIKEAHNRGRSSILQDEMIARRRMRLKEV